MNIPPERVALPRPAGPSPPTRLARADLLLAVFVIVLAFLVASTAARNSDLFLHLATGRAIADGSYRFHGDPFGQNSTLRVAHSWLYDLTTYALYEWLGGSVLVFLKAALVALLAALLIRLGKRERGLAWPAVGATLAVMALSGRLLLQPALVSMLLLAATMWLLDRARTLRTTERQASWLRTYGPLCVLFALWANVDDWFLLGPLTVGLYLLGEALSVVGSTETRERADLLGLGVLLGVGMLACLLTPFHFHGIALPAELGLSAMARALEQDPALRGLFLSPFDGTYFRVGAAWSVPGMAYLTLALLSLLSFAGSRIGWRSWRLPVWLGFFALSVWSVRALPFFAVVAGPILALNLQDFVRRFDAASPRRDDLLLARLGRAATLLLLFGLLIAAWPGFLQNPPYEMRRWIVLADPSLEAAARQFTAWRKNGSLKEGEHGFNFSPEVANYFAWFCPAEKGIVDSRLQISAAEAADYVTVRRALLGDASSETDWRGILRARRVNHVILYDSNHERVSDAYRRLAYNAEEWSLLFLAGRTAIFGWRDSQHPGNSLDELRLPLAQEAYHPAPSRQAPAEWPGRGPQLPAWWNAFLTARPAGTPDREEAALLLLHFETRREATRSRRNLAWEASRITVAVAAGGQTLPVRLQQTLDCYCVAVLHAEAPSRRKDRMPTLEDLALALRDNYLLTRDDAPPEYLWMGLRAARRALHDNPDDAHAYLILGEVYLRLAHNTRERVWATHLPFLRRLRETQASAALNQALLVQPDLLLAHTSLATLYQDMGYWDLRRHHLREVLRLTQAKGCPPSERITEWDARLSRLKEYVQQVETELQQIENKYEVNTANLKNSDRARVALERGLAEKALNLLLAADVASFGERGARMELSLLLATGRLREVREWMSPEQKKLLGEENYLLLRLQLASACGDYEQADAELAEALAITEAPIYFKAGEVPIRDAVALALGRLLLGSRLENQSLGQRGVVLYNRELFLRVILELTGRLRKAADMTVLRGLLALERGDTGRAERLFRRALDIYQTDSTLPSKGLGSGGRPVAQHFVELLNQ